jgi:hypothetical protein
MEIDKKSFKKMFPNLSGELEGGDGKVAIGAVRTDSDAAEKSKSDKFRNYDPTVAELRKQLKKEGVRSFGSKKEDNYYFKQGGLC